MSSNLFHIVTLLLGFCLLAVLPLVDAGLYVVTPTDQSTCRGGKPCTVTWLDDGISPLLPAIGVSTIGLYTGTQKLVQTFPPVDVSTTLSFTFTADPAVGPNSGAYYIAFTSTESKVNGTQPYVAFSPWFRLEGMTGSFDRPLPSATRSIPIPSSLTVQRPSSTILSTITVGTLSSALPISISVPSPSPTAPPTPVSSSSPSLSSSSSSSRLVTSISPSTTATPSGTAAPSLGNSTSGAGTGNHLSYLSLCITFIIAVALT